MVEHKNNILDSGFTRQQTEYALKKAWIGYDLSNKKNDIEGKKYYAWIIYKLQRELGMHTTPFREVKMLALKYYRNNPEIKETLEGGKILKIMIERGYEVGKPYNKKNEDKVE
jgi:hypothetical protein